MLQLEKDGTLIGTGTTKGSTGWTKGTIELPVDLLDEQSDLIDRIFTFAFDVLDLQSMELRIRPSFEEPGARYREAATVR